MPSLQTNHFDVFGSADRLKLPSKNIKCLIHLNSPLSLKLNDNYANG